MESLLYERLSHTLHQKVIHDAKSILAFSNVNSYGHIVLAVDSGKS